MHAYSYCRACCPKRAEHERDYESHRAEPIEEAESLEDRVARLEALMEQLLKEQSV